MEKIRSAEASKKDAEKLAACLNTWSEDDSWGGSFGSTKFTTEGVFSEWLEQSKMIDQMILIDDDEVKAYCSLDHHWEDKDAAYIPLLGARPKEQGKGFGKALLLEALRRSIKLGKRRLDLHTWPGNIKAVPLYKKTGFMWVYKTSVLMQNYLPAILSTSLFKPFFAKNDHYTSRDIIIDQVQDEFKHLGMQAYFYRFKQDENNSLTVYIDTWAKDLSGFSLVENGKELNVQLVPNIHEAFLGLDLTTAELRITNNQEKTITLTGLIKPFKQLEMITPEKIEITIQPGEEKVISIEAKLKLDSETLIPSENTDDRTKCRFELDLEIDNLSCQLGTGWVPKDTVQIIMDERSLTFERESEEETIPIGFRNMTSEKLKGTIIVSGEELGSPMSYEFTAGRLTAFEKKITLTRPKEAMARALKWTFNFVIDAKDGERKLPPIIKHVGCFTQPGSIAYFNPQEFGIIENDQLRFHFSYRTEAALTFIHSKTTNWETNMHLLPVLIGMPLPDESSEFWGQVDSYDVVKTERGVSLQQTFHSKNEKPGLKAVRVIEIETSKPYLHTYYIFTNTNSDKEIKDVAVRTMAYGSTMFQGPITLPLKSGFLTSNDTEYSDRRDFPLDPSDYAEPWAAREPYNGIGLGVGVIWKEEEAKKISYAAIPHVDTISYTLAPGETIKTAHVTYVFGLPAVQATRNIWLNEFNGKSILSKEKEHAAWSNPILEVIVGEKLVAPETDNPFSLNWIDLEEEQIPVKIEYRSTRETPTEVKLSIESTLWPETELWKTELISEKTTEKYITFDKPIELNLPQIINCEGSLKLGHTIRRFEGALIPYCTTGKVTLEKEGNHWVFSNGLISFKTSNTHGASLFSAEINGQELFFSRYPDKESFAWFKNFVGGIHPFISQEGAWGGHEFFKDTWTSPKLIEENGWTGLRYEVDVTHKMNLRGLRLQMTYFTRANSPLLWSSLKVINNSGITSNFVAVISMYLNPINEIYFPWDNDFWIGTATEKDKGVNTMAPNNWSVVDLGQEKPKMLFATTRPLTKLGGSRTNANGYSNYLAHEHIKLRPGESKSIETIMLLGQTIDELSSPMTQWRPIVKL
ncbi:MAG: GNAT family N-acetyltransferase [Candidatus Kariarchaeaceae archaeon]